MVEQRMFRTGGRMKCKEEFERWLKEDVEKIICSDKPSFTKGEYDMIKEEK